MMSLQINVNGEQLIQHQTLITFVLTIPYNKRLSSKLKLLSLSVNLAVAVFDCF